MSLYDLCAKTKYEYHDVGRQKVKHVVFHEFMVDDEEYSIVKSEDLRYLIKKLR